MVEVSTFWNSLKCSWTRRILQSNAFWPKILEKNLAEQNFATNDLLFSGPAALLALSKKIKNQFWQNFLTSVSSLLKETPYALPENFYLLPVFNNPLFKTGRICLKNVGFGNPTHNIKLVADLYSSSGQIGTLADINTKFGTEISQFQFNRIHTALNSGRNLLNLNIGLCNWHQEPRQSALIQISCTQL